MHSCCRVQGLANVSAQTCQNGQLVIVERLVAKGKLKGRFKCRVIGTQQVFALKQENIVKCENVPQVLYLAPVTADLLHSSKPGKSGPNASRDATTAAAGAVSEEPGLVTVDVSAVEQTCEAFSSTALCKSFVEIDEANVKRFAAELAMLVEKGGDPAAEIRRGATGACRRLPLQFDSPDIEINYWVTRNLLNFGSGHMDGGASNFGGARELADIVDRGCLTTFLTRSQKFDAEFMSRFGLHDVQQLFGIKVEEDVDIIGSAVKRSQLGGRRLALAQLIVRVACGVWRAMIMFAFACACAIGRYGACVGAVVRLPAMCMIEGSNAQRHWRATETTGVCGLCRRFENCQGYCSGSS